MRSRSVVTPKLSDIAAFDESTGRLRAVIETPKGSHNKYDYDPDLCCFELAAIAPEGMDFPYDFGFIPSTQGEDGDPIDVLVLTDFPLVMGCCLQIRLLGAIEAEQREKGKEWYRNDRLIAVASQAHIFAETCSLDDLPSGFLKNIKAFFVEYNKLHEREFRPIADASHESALRLVKEGMEKRGRSH
jgi:inorganic pyrophosphatase